MKKILFRILVVILVSVAAYSAYQVWLVNAGNAEESKQHEALLRYRPALPAPSDHPDPSPEGTDPPDPAPSPKANQQILDLQTRYPDIVGWLTVPNTKIDYPFAQASDNDYYIHSDLNGKYLAAGTLFLDFRNRGDLSDFNNIVYGHHMKNGSMLGTLKYFNDKQFFDDNKTGILFLADQTYTLEFFAYIVLEPDNAQIYNPLIIMDADKKNYLSYVKESARYYRDIGVTGNDHILVLSTCDYEFSNARMALLGRLVEG